MGRRHPPLRAKPASALTPFDAADTITSVKVQALGASPACVPGASQVAFFIDANYSGGCVVRGPGAYPTSGSIGLPNRLHLLLNVGNYANAAAIGLADNSISSLRIGRSVQACACDDENYATTCLAFLADSSNLGDASGNWNDRISSLKVAARGQPCVAVVRPALRGRCGLADARAERPALLVRRRLVANPDGRHLSSVHQCF
jgi:hypothetical protein